MVKIVVYNAMPWCNAAYCNATCIIIKEIRRKVATLNNIFHWLALVAISLQKLMQLFKTSDNSPPQGRILSSTNARSHVLYNERSFSKSVVKEPIIETATNAINQSELEARNATSRKRGKSCVSQIMIGLQWETSSMDNGLWKVVMWSTHIRTVTHIDK